MEPEGEKRVIEKIREILRVGKPSPPKPEPTPLAATVENPVGETVSLEDYSIFQASEATATDLESLVMLERSLAKSEIRRGVSNIMKYAGFIFVIAIIVVIILYLLPDLLKGLGP